jgi:iron complex outermembrane receptor protein
MGKKNEIDFGLDFTLLNSRLTGTIDYYNRNTEDLIFPVTVPVPPNFVPTKYLNIGTLASSGFELTLGYDIIKNKDFTWNASGNLSTYKTVLKSLDPSLAGSYVGATNLGTPGQESTQITRAVVGQKLECSGVTCSRALTRMANIFLLI